jgi:hypothetical protein
MRPVFALMVAALVAAWAPWRARTYLGTAQPIGGGTAQSYLTVRPDGVPEAIGVRLSAGALERLPAEPNRHSRCFDLDGNGSHGGHECIGDEQRILDLPAAMADDLQLPFKWLTLNWNAAGHPAPYNRPHFDFHFFALEREKIEAIRPGRCGELTDCEDFERATRPLPAEYMPDGHISVGAVVPRMGNHLLDSRSPELADSMPFTNTFIYGAFDRELIFWEPMITLDVLRAATTRCFEIGLPRAFQRSGYYPTRYCVRRDGPSDGRTVSLEGFIYAEAGAAVTPEADNRPSPRS